MSLKGIPLCVCIQVCMHVRVCERCVWECVGWQAYVCVSEHMCVWEYVAKSAWAPYYCCLSVSGHSVGILLTSLALKISQSLIIAATILGRVILKYRLNKNPSKYYANITKNQVQVLGHPWTAVREGKCGAYISTRERHHDK